MSYSYENYLNNQFKFSYDTNKYDFVKIIKKIFDDLQFPIEKLHMYIENSINQEQITIDNDTSTMFHKKYYNSPYYNEMIILYQHFIKEVVLPLINCEDTEFVIQKEPSFRIHLPNNTALGYRPNRGDPDDKIGLHCDGDYGHQITEINFMLTFGPQFGNNSCYVETSPGNAIFVPLEMNYGEFISFYGNQCRHYNKRNDTNISRVSIDFRIIPLSKYDPNCNNISLHSKRKFLIGDYYTIIHR